MSSSYTPNDLITRFHSVHRYGADLKEVPNTFSIDFDGNARGYFEGVLFQAGGMAALAALLFIVFGITFLVGCCCRHRVGGGGDKSSKSGRCARIGYMFSCFLLVGGAGVAMWYMGDFEDGMTTLITGLIGFRSLFLATSTDVNTNLLGNITALNATAGTLQALAAGTGVQADATNLAAQAASALAQCAALAFALNSSASTLQQDFPFDEASVDAFQAAASASSVRIDLEAAKMGLTHSSYALLGSAIGFLILNALLMVANRCVARLFKACSFVTLSAATLITLFAAVLYIPALMGSDVCVDPSTAISSVFNSTNASPQVADTWGYYSTCGADASIAPSGAYAQALGASTLVTTALANFDVINNTVVNGGAPYAALVPYMSDLSVSLMGANASMTSILASVSCANVNGLWVQVEDGLCNGAILGTIHAFLALAGATTAMMLLLVFTACIIFNHPGDAEGGGGQQDNKRSGTVGKSYEELYQSITPATGGKSGPAYGSYANKNIAPQAGVMSGPTRGERVAAKSAGGASAYTGKDW